MCEGGNIMRYRQAKCGEMFKGVAFETAAEDADVPKCRACERRSS